MEIFIFAIIGAILFFSAPLMPATWRFASTILLSAPQLYLVPVGDFYVSLALISAFFLWPEAIKEARNLLRQKVLYFALAVLIIQAISLLWSTDLRLGLRTLVYALPFLLVAAAAYSLAKHNRRFVYTILGITGVVMIFEATLVVLFRLSPELEMAYLNSNLSGLFSGPNTISALIDESQRNNVLDPEKSGGIFTNGNIAAAYLGMGAFITFMASRINKSKILFISAATLWISTLFTGSKAGIMLAVSLPLSALAFIYYSKNDKRSRSILLLGTLISAPIIFTFAIYALDSLAQKSSFAAASIETASTRLLIWEYAAQAFFDSPIFGQGFGGWQHGYYDYALSTGIPPSFPPHNTLIYLWSQSGILATVLAFVFMFHVYRLAYRLTAFNKHNERLLGLTLGTVASFLFIQGMGENWGLFGDPHQQPILATLVGLAYSTLRTAYNRNIFDTNAAFTSRP